MQTDRTDAGRARDGAAQPGNDPDRRDGGSTPSRSKDAGAETADAATPVDANVPPKPAACSRNSDCSDGDACSGKETCEAGKCVASAALVCEDNNPCTTDGCSADSGCTHTTRDEGSECGTCQRCDAAGTCRDALEKHGDCGSCQQCAPGGGCEDQGSSDDLKDECADGPCRTGSCDGNGSCGVITPGTDCGTCSACDAAGECNDDLTQHSDCESCEQCAPGGSCEPQESGADLKNECDVNSCGSGACDGAGACGVAAVDAPCGACRYCDASQMCIEDLAQSATCMSGDVLYETDFEEDSDDIELGGDSWDISDGTLNQDEDCDANDLAFLAGGENWTNVQADVDLVATDVGRGVGCPGFGQMGLTMRSSGDPHCSTARYYVCVLDFNSDQMLMGELNQNCGSSSAKTVKNTPDLDEDTGYHLRMTVQGNSISCWASAADGSWTLNDQFNDSSFTSGTVGLMTSGSAGSYDNLTVTLLAQ